ncbi:hypothetical protein [Jannaschia seohaensis]|uniref:Acyltransferase n=1 Tax=Jannaschia seohaensis TaxID=475081 RepID=A0A2Y9C302_9RHOB|nr:hypothetical protein [Jannaschia seohaensis]PWJ13296.1 hypothetical protein BCF38_11459 [Jannaschia seohaensis]SSA50622.1 hypothetical protein SAMN05421539_11459 [Jannaschia seohaensis]
MLPLITAAAGAIAGALYVRRKNGNGFDMAQYAAVWAVIGGLLGLLAIVLLTRV